MKGFINKKILWLVIISVVLSMSIVFPEGASAQDKFRVPKDPPKAHYKIDARIDVSKGITDGKGTISFTNNSRKEMHEIAIDWRISPASSIEVAYDGSPLRLLNVTEHSIVISPLFYGLQEPLSPGESIELIVSFSTKNIDNTDPEIIQMVNWYPRLWWDDLPVSESFEVKLDTPPGYALAASGRLNENTGYYENEGVKTFGVYMGKGLKTQSRDADGVLVTSLFTENGSQCALLCLETAEDVVKFYKKWHGFYPFKFLYIIPGASRPMGGYPFASGVVVIHGQEQFEKRELLHWQWITAHEIGHQYWGEYVMDDDVIPWLWIGMGIYTDKQYVLYRNLGLKRHTNMFSRYLLGMQLGHDTTVDIPLAQRRKVRYDHNNIVIHGKGFSIISALESTLGEETFKRIYMKCLKEYGGKRLGYKEFRRVCEEESGENLKWFFDQWVRSNKHLSCEVISQKSKEENGEYITTIEVANTGTLKMPVPVKAVFEDGSSQVQYINRFSTINNLIFKSQAKLKEVIIDPDSKLAILKEEIREREEKEESERRQVNVPESVTPEELKKIISRLPYSGVDETILNVFEKANSLNLDITNYWFKLGMLLFDDGHYKESFEAFKRVTELNPDQLLHFTAFVWMGQLKDLQGDRWSAVKYYKEALKHDTGETMQHDQYGMRLNGRYVQEKLKIPFKWTKK